MADVFYNNYKVYQLTIGPESLTSAWWQVLWFDVPLGEADLPGAQWPMIPEGCSHALVYIESDRLRQPEVQRRIDIFAGALLIAWILLMFIAVIQVKGNVLGLFAPYLGFRANPWARSTNWGWLLGRYLSRCLSSSRFWATFGVIAAVALNPKTRNIALTVCFLALPYYIFDRTRNTMLATMLPGILAFVFFRLRRNKWIKLGFLIAAFIAMDAPVQPAVILWPPSEWRFLSESNSRSFAPVRKSKKSKPWRSDTRASTCSKNWPGLIGS